VVKEDINMAQIVDPVVPVTNVSQIKSAEVDALFDKHLKRLGHDTPEAREQLYQMALNYGLVESSGLPDAENSESSATGLYQFLTGKGTANEGQKNSSLHGAVNRAKRTLDSPWLDEVYESGNIQDLTPAQQTVLLFGDLLEKTVSDTPGYGDILFKTMLDTNNTDRERRAAERQLYLDAHHTDPDVPTMNNLDEKLPNIPENYDAFGTVLKKPDSEPSHVNTGRATLIDPNMMGMFQGTGEF
tara:strand:+ start:1798 stop:2526 length:729 start_codon:yes stop_codon:yes gene_type:complete